MNTSRLLPLLLSFALFPAMALAAANAQRPEPAPETPEWAATFGRAALPAVWQAAVSARDRIAAALAAKQFDGVADAAERIHLAAHALDDQLTLPDPERARRLRAALRQAAKLADGVMDAAGHEKPAETAEAFRRLHSSLQVAQLRLPPEITAGSPASAPTAPGPRVP